MARLQSVRARAACVLVAAAVAASGGLLPGASALLAAPRPLAIDFAGSGNVSDAAAFGLYGAAVEVTLWAATGIAAGPTALAAGAGGAYAWAFSQAPQTGLLNLTLRAWLPWDPNISLVRVFDVSNGTPRTDYSGEALALPFTASELATLAAPSATVVIPRGRQVAVEFRLLNDGNVSLAHPGFALSVSSPNITAGLVNASPALVEERPGTAFFVNATFSAPPGAGLQGASGNLTVPSTSGTNFTFPFALRVAGNRNTALANLTTVPLPPDEGRPAQIRLRVENRGLDLASAADVFVQAFYASIPDVYLNNTAVDVPPNGSAVAVFEWTPRWTPEGATVQASVAAQDDYDPSDDSATAAFAVNSTDLPPAVVFSSPTEGARVSGNITVAGTAQDPEGALTQLEVRLDGGAPLFRANATAFGFVLDLAPLPDGPHRLEARATDARGLVSNATVNLTVLNRGPNAAPTVAVSTPLDGDTVGASFVVRGSAADERNELASVLVSLDGGAPRTANGTTSWSLAVDGAALGDGPHLVSVRAFDGIDYSATAAFNVTVNATPPTGLAVAGAQLSPDPSVPNEALTLSGTVSFDSGVLAFGANITAVVRGFVGSASTLADARGRFSLTLTAPSAAGDFTIDLAAVSGSLQGNTTVAMHVSTASLPDLELLPSALTLSPDPPPPQTPIHHTLEIYNRGVGTANATLRVWDGPRGSTLVYEWAFQVTTSRQAAFDYSYAPGLHNLTVALDAVSPQDADLSDNEMVVAVTVPEAPDFIVESVQASSPDILEGLNITFLVVVRNGAATAGFVNVELWDGAPLGANSSKIGDQNIGVQAGARERLLFSWTPKPGSHNIVAQAVLASPQELNLTNNLANVSVEVRPIDNGQAPVFLPGFGALGGLAAVAGVGAARKRRRAKGRRANRAALTAVLLLVVLAVAAALVPAPSSAGTAAASAMPGPLNGVCQTCHTDPQGGGALNSFGASYRTEANTSGGAVNWTRLGAMDSDGDGFTNEAEWSQSYLPGDPHSNPRDGFPYAGFGGGGVSGLVTGLAALLVVSLVGVWLGVYMVNKRKARLAAKEAAAKDAPAPKP